MKTLSSSRPLLIMVIGLPGAGKSFFAQQFAQTFDAPLCSIDRLRYELFAQPQFTPNEEAILTRLQHYMVGELAKTKRSFLIDGQCNNKSERRKLRAMAEVHGYGTLVVWVQTDQSTALGRVQKRGLKRTGDPYSASLNAEQFNQLVKRGGPPTDEEYVVISGKHSYSTQAKMVLRKLAGPRAEEAAEAHRQEGKAPERPVKAIRPETAARRNVIIR